VIPDPSFFVKARKFDNFSITSWDFQKTFVSKEALQRMRIEFLRYPTTPLIMYFFTEITSRR